MPYANPGSCHTSGIIDRRFLTYWADKAFRHLDIENILVNLVRWNGSSAGGLMGILGSVTGGGEKKFTKADVHRVYFVSFIGDILHHAY